MRIRVPSVARAAVLSACLSLLAALACLAGCGSKPSSPEALFAKLQTMNAAGDSDGMWDLLTEESRQGFMAAIDEHRKVLMKNPDPKEKLTRQYNCTREEFMRLPYTELWHRENLGRERALVDAKITDRSRDPRHPGEEVLTITPPAGPRVSLRVRNSADGWEWINMRVEAL